MSFTLTAAAENASESNQITPQLVLQIEGVDTLYGAVVIKKTLKIGDFEIGEPGAYIGGSIAIGDQESLISFQSGTSTDISQTLNIDKGSNESISSMKIALIDRSLKITRLITPGEVVTDMLGRNCKVWLGFAQTSWKDDYLIIFRGSISSIDSKSGIILLDISSPDNKKRGALFPLGSTKLTASMTNVQTTATVTDTTSFLTLYTGPDATIDTTFLKLYIRIDDEIMRYESTTGTQFGTLTRGALLTTAAVHSNTADVSSFYVIGGNAIDIALKLMLSGKNGPYVTGLEPTNFVNVGGAEEVPNSIYFLNYNLKLENNPVVGDYVTTTGASNGANNVTLKQITAVTQSDTGYYIEVDGVTFVTELNTAAVMSIRSQYDVGGPNAGMALGNDEVDIDEHLDIKTKYLSSAEYLFYLKDTIEDGKEFLSEKVYNPLSTYSIPRKAQSSVGIHIGPIPGVSIKKLDTTNVLNASTLNLQRTINKNFFNSIIYRYDVNTLEDKYNSGQVTIDGTSITQIPVGNKPLIIDADGMRSVLSATNLAQIAGNRRLRKYKFGAEFIQKIEVNFKTGFDIEIGDKIIVDMTSLKLADIHSATRSGANRLFEVVNKKLIINTGKISLDIVDTNYSLDTRYSLIAPSSRVKSATSTSEFLLKPSYSTTKYGSNEGKKWLKYIGAGVVIRNSDYSISDTSTIQDVSGNTIILTTALAFTPLVDYIMEFGDYDLLTDDVKLIYASQSDGDNNFADGKIPYQMS